MAVNNLIPNSGESMEDFLKRMATGAYSNNGVSMIPYAGVTPPQKVVTGNTTGGSVKGKPVSTAQTGNPMAGNTDNVVTGFFPIKPATNTVQGKPVTTAGKPVVPTVTKTPTTNVTQLKTTTPKTGELIGNNTGYTWQQRLEFFKDPTYKTDALAEYRRALAVEAEHRKNGNTADADKAKGWADKVRTNSGLTDADLGLVVNKETVTTGDNKEVVTTGDNKEVVITGENKNTNTGYFNPVNTENLVNNQLTNYFNTTDADKVNSAESIYQQFLKIIGGDNTPYKTPDILSWDQALTQSSQQMNPLYDAKKVQLEKDMQRMGIKSGFLGQLPWQMFEAQNQSTLENDRATQTANLANSLVSQSKTDRQQAIDNENQRKRDLYSRFTDALNMTNASQKDKLDVATRFLEQLQNYQLGNQKLESNALDLSMKKIDAENYETIKKLDIANLRTRNDLDDAKLAMTKVDVSQYPQEAALRLKSAIQAYDIAGNDEERRQALFTSQKIIADNNAKQSDINTKYYEDNALIDNQIKKNEGKQSDINTEFYRRNAEAETKKKENATSMSDIDLKYYDEEVQTKLKDAKARAASATTQAEYDAAVKDFDVTIAEAKKDMELTKKKIMDKDFSIYDEEQALKLRDLKAKVESAETDADIARSTKDYKIAEAEADKQLKERQAKIAEYEADMKWYDWTNYPEESKAKLEILLSEAKTAKTKEDYAAKTAEIDYQNKILAKDIKAQDLIAAENKAFTSQIAALMKQIDWKQYGTLAKAKLDKAVADANNAMKKGDRDAAIDGLKATLLGLNIDTANVNLASKLDQYRQSPIYKRYETELYRRMKPNAQGKLPYTIEATKKWVSSLPDLTEQEKVALAKQLASQESKSTSSNSSGGFTKK